MKLHSILYILQSLTTTVLADARKKRRHSTIIILAFFSLIILLSIIQNYHYNAFFKKEMQKSANQIVQSSAPLLWSYDLTLVENKLASFLKNRNIQRIKIMEKGGHVLIDLNKENKSIDINKNNIFTITSKDIEYMKTNFILSLTYTTLYKNKTQSIFTLSFIIISFLFCIFILKQILTKNINNDKIDTEERSSFISIKKQEKDNISYSQNEPRKLTEETREKIEKAIEFIHENYKYNISREGLAANLDINPDNLGRFFKKYTGEKINDRINRLRIEEAVRLIQESDKSITEISYFVGFDNASTFYRSFMKHMNLSPTDFKENKK